MSFTHSEWFRLGALIFRYLMTQFDSRITMRYKITSNLIQYIRALISGCTPSIVWWKRRCSKWHAWMQCVFDYLGLSIKKIKLFLWVLSNHSAVEHLAKPPTKVSPFISCNIYFIYRYLFSRTTIVVQTM